MAADLSGIIINEVLADPNTSGVSGYDLDGDGFSRSNEEYVELYNSSGVPVDISGWTLWDAGQDDWFTFPGTPGDGTTVLNAGGYAIVTAGGDASAYASGNDVLTFSGPQGQNQGIMNNGGDNIVLLDPNTNTFIQAVYGGDTVDDPTIVGPDYVGFPAGATLVGVVDDFGNDTDGSSIQRSPDGSDTFVVDVPTPGSGNVCFTSGTMIATPGGEREIDELRVGDLVSVRDGEPQAIRWIHSRLLPKTYLEAEPKKYPIKIKAGALGDGVPNVDLSVSPQHRLLLTGKIAMRMFDTDEILVGATFLTELDGVSVDEAVDGVTYYHIMLDQHQVMCANGAPAESLYLGKQARLSLSSEALQEVFSLFPELNDADFNVRAARRIVSGKPARQLIQRHIKNAKPVFA